MNATRCKCDGLRGKKGERVKSHQTQMPPLVCGLEAARIPALIPVRRHPIPDESRGRRELMSGVIARLVGELGGGGKTSLPLSTGIPDLPPLSIGMRVGRTRWNLWSQTERSWLGLGDDDCWRDMAGAGLVVMVADDKVEKRAGGGNWKDKRLGNGWCLMDALITARHDENMTPAQSRMAQNFATISAFAHNSYRASSLRLGDSIATDWHGALCGLDSATRDTFDILRRTTGAGRRDYNILATANGINAPRSHVIFSARRRYGTATQSRPALAGVAGVRKSHRDVPLPPSSQFTFGRPPLLRFHTSNPVLMIP
ncbi:hypothetical protein BJ322DRAFT_1020249 [Thelephora terrestris]|uniref:Uncharacterized protein n=1 Tax=Thelephora terrestris TaxID=56493 RepID=A0A9P6HG72_9AGAM|nr:hypothetical protein BJ322DRAFT_1020249 [Thelephora terrestris]